MIESIEYYKKNCERISTAGQPTENEIKLIAQEGFEIIINARFQKEMDELFDEKSIAESFGVKYFQIETELSNPNYEELLRFLEIMESHKQNKIFFHCRTNKRAIALLAIYRIVKLGWNKSDAINKIKEVWEITPEIKDFIDIQLELLS